MTDLRSQLQSTLGDGYTLERELGGGGMSRVFVVPWFSVNVSAIV
jgi:hypothetical protein